jgi:hypothetical protein
VSGLSCTLSGLTNYTTYYVWVVAANASGSGGASDPGTGFVGVKLESIALSMSSYTFLVGERESIKVTYTPPKATQPYVTWTTTSSDDASIEAVNSATERVTAGSTAGTSRATLTATPVYTGGGATAQNFTVHVKAYNAGDAGPAGGKLFYNGGSYATDGFKYMEVYAPAVVTLYQGSASVQWEPDAAWNKAIETSSAFGTGKSNTDNIIAVVSLFDTSSNYGARYCKNFSLGGYADWFLPSKDEISAFIGRLGTITTAYSIWSSSIDSSNPYSRAYIYTYSGSWYWSSGATTTTKSSAILYIPVRRF